MAIVTKEGFTRKNQRGYPSFMRNQGQLAWKQA